MSVRLQPGDPAPAFTLPDADGQPVALSSFAGQRVILYAYPAAMTPGCTKQACDFRDSLDSLRRGGLPGARDLAGPAREAGASSASATA